MVEIQADEYGGGDPRRIHAQLFADAMDALGLDSRYGAYVDRIPGVTWRPSTSCRCSGFTAACAGRSSATWRCSR